MTEAVLVIAGFDPSGGAGVLRDVATLRALGVRARAVVAALTAQDETRFDGWVAVDPAFLRLQIDYDLMEQRRKMGAELERITPRVV